MEIFIAVVISVLVFIFYFRGIITGIVFGLSLLGGSFLGAVIAAWMTYMFLTLIKFMIIDHMVDWLNRIKSKRS